MERIFASTNKVILDSGNGAGPGVVPYLPLSGLNPGGQAVTGGGSGGSQQQQSGARQ